MGFFEFVWLFSLTVLLPLAIVKITTDYKRQKLEVQQAEQEVKAGLTVGELKNMLRQVVEEANEPIVDRVDHLERRLLPESEPQPLIENAERTVGRQTVR